jgi:hypothetical protein
MALDLEIAGECRELTDLELSEAESSTAKPPIVKRLRDSHHALARALASGMSPLAASLATGYSASRISILLNDPSFKELMEHYRRTNAEAILDIEGRITGLAADFLQELRERLEDNPESFDNEEVRENTKLFLDRAGYAPISRSINVNHNTGIGSRLDRLNGRVKRDDAA